MCSVPVCIYQVHACTFLTGVCISEPHACSSQVPHRTPELQFCISEPRACSSQVPHRTPELQFCISDTQACSSQVPHHTPELQFCISDTQECISNIQFCISEPLNCGLEAPPRFTPSFQATPSLVPGSAWNAIFNKCQSSLPRSRLRLECHFPQFPPSFQAPPGMPLSIKAPAFILSTCMPKHQSGALVTICVPSRAWNEG